MSECQNYRIICSASHNSQRKSQSHAFKQHQTKDNFIRISSHEAFPHQSERIHSLQLPNRAAGIHTTTRTHPSVNFSLYLTIPTQRSEENRVSGGGVSLTCGGDVAAAVEGRGEDVLGAVEDDQRGREQPRLRPRRHGHRRDLGTGDRSRAPRSRGGWRRRRR